MRSRSAELRNLGKAVRSRSAELQNLGKAVRSRSAELQNLGKAVRSRSAELQNLGKAVHSRSAELRNLGKAVHSRSAELQNLGKAVHSRSAELRNLGKAVHSRSAVLQCRRARPGAPEPRLAVPHHPTQRPSEALTVCGTHRAFHRADQALRTPRTWHGRGRGRRGGRCGCLPGAWGETGHAALPRPDQIADVAVCLTKPSAAETRIHRLGSCPTRRHRKPVDPEPAPPAGGHTARRSAVQRGRAPRGTRGGARSGGGLTLEQLPQHEL